MDRRIGGRNGIEFENLPDTNRSFSVYDPVKVHHMSLGFDPPTAMENEVHEDCDLSDAILGYISQVLMEEDMEDKSCMLYDLQAAEKSFYEVLYPPSPDQGLFSVDHSPHHHTSSLDADDHVSPANSTDHYYSQNYDSNLHNNNNNNSNVSQSSKSNNNVSFLTSSEIYDKNQMMMKFNEGFEEANKFLPTDNNLFNANGGGSRVRKSCCYELDEDHQRSNKQAAIFGDATLRSNEIDLILLCSMGQGDVALRLMRNTLRTQTTKDRLSKGQKTRAKKPLMKNKKQVIDLTTLLVTCAQAVATDDTRNATELLRQIRQHASPFGDGNQRLAHCFANGLEARLAGIGTQIYRGLVTKKTSAADYIKAYYLYIASSPFRKISNFASNRTIIDMAENATRIHVIDFGILYGFQWPTFIQRISQRKGGPPRVRLTGIEFPQPGFRPAETIEETGARLKEYANRFNVPFEYNAIAKRWENVNIEDLQIDRSEFLVVNCMYRSKNLLDETVGLESARNVVLNLIKKIRPNIFVHGILNGSYNAPFFLTRFKEAVFHFSALFDMLETNVPRERSERMLLEGEVFGREALNVIACEGWERIERPETYKQWHVRNLRAGFVSFRFLVD